MCNAVRSASSAGGAYENTGLSFKSAPRISLFKCFSGSKVLGASETTSFRIENLSFSTSYFVALVMQDGVTNARYIFHAEKLSSSSL
ncbi:hypothetical protein D3C77_725850 [compost metagenome]